MLDTNKCHGLTCWITSDDKVVAKELDMPDEFVPVDWINEYNDLLEMK